MYTDPVESTIHFIQWVIPITYLVIATRGALKVIEHSHIALVILVVFIKVQLYKQKSQNITKIVKNDN